MTTAECAECGKTIAVGACDCSGEGATTIVGQAVIVVTLLSTGEVSIRSLGAGDDCEVEKYADDVVGLLRSIFENEVKGKQ